MKPRATADREPASITMAPPGLRCRPVVAAVAGLLLLHLDAGHAVAQDTLESILQTNEVTIGISGEVPYAYRDESGEVTGEAPEIAREILARIAPDIEIEWVEVPFGQLIPGLQADEFDIAAAGMFITPQRCEQVAFSEPTYVVGEAFAVKTGNPKNITNYETISEDHDAKVGLIAGTVEYNYALVTGIPADRAPLYRNFDKAIEALKEGEVDAVGLTALTAQNIVDGEPDLEATPQFFPELDGEVVKGYGGFAFREADQDLRDAFNAELGKFVGTDEHWELVEPFGFTPDMAPDMTAEQLCQS